MVRKGIGSISILPDTSIHYMSTTAKQSEKTSGYNGNKIEEKEMIVDRLGIISVEAQ